MNITAWYTLFKNVLSTMKFIDAQNSRMLYLFFTSSIIIISMLVLKVFWVIFNMTIQVSYHNYNFLVP